MHKLAVFVAMLLALLLTAPANAQVELGFLGGMNIANVSSDFLDRQNFDLSSRTAFGFGGVLDYTIAENISFRAEPMYLQKGCKATMQAFGVDATFKASYLELPLMLKYAIGTGEVKPYVMAGPAVGYLLSAKMDNQVGPDEDVKEDSKSFDLGFGFGAGISYPIADNSIFIEGRYTLGLLDVADDPEEPDMDIKTSGFQFFTGITIPLGQR